VIVPPEINVPEPGKAILIVGRDPGEQEVALGRPFVGAAGKELDHALAEAGLERQDVNIANVVPVRPPNNDFSQHSPEAIAKGQALLFHLIQQLRPPLIIALGNEASYTLIPNWPTRGRGIYGAKDIQDRRGFVWQTEHGLVLATLHPAGVLRQPVPSRYLLQSDFRKAKRLLREAPEPLPEARPLTVKEAERLQQHQLVAWDIETQWGGKAISMMGFCGDDEQPYVAADPSSIHKAALPLLRASVPKCGHNGWHFDIPAVMLHYGFQPAHYDHDTQVLWWAIDPELAGGIETETGASSQLTRKGLAFLASLFLNTFWWKEYSDDTEQMITLNARDVWATRKLFNILLKEALKLGVINQYHLALQVAPFLLEAHLYGVPIDRKLLEERVQALHERSEQSRQRSVEAAVAYLQTLPRSSFLRQKRCTCCGGGTVVSASHCWRCGGLPQKPTKKSDYLDLPGRTIAEKRLALPPCQTCHGTGKQQEILFNPFSPQQLYRLLCQHLGAPVSRWKGKVKMDEEAIRRIYRWSLR
jgi:uracil-DNA glycosylase family 4